MPILNLYHIATHFCWLVENIPQDKFFWFLCSPPNVQISYSPTAQLWMTLPSTVCTFECNLSLILLVIVLPCTLSFSSLCYRAPCPFPPCSTVHLVIFLLVLPCTLSVPPCSTLHLVHFLLVLPCTLSFSSRWFHPDPCHFPQVSSHLLFSLASHPWHGAGTPGFVFQGHISSIQKWFVKGPAFSQLNHTLGGGSQCRVVDQTCKVCESTNRWLCTMRVK